MDLAEVTQLLVDEIFMPGFKNKELLIGWAGKKSAHEIFNTGQPQAFFQTVSDRGAPGKKTISLKNRLVLYPIHFESSLPEAIFQRVS